MQRRTFLKRLLVVGGAWVAAQRAGWLPSALAQEQLFFVPPTVHHVSEDSATLVFRLSLPTANGLVRVFEGDQPVLELPYDASATLWQQVVVPGPQASHTYRYQVEADGAVPLALMAGQPGMPWEGLSFRTQPHPFPLRVAAVGDSGFGHTITRELGQVMAQQQPDFFIHLGDVVYWMHQYNGNAYLNWMEKYFIPFQDVLARGPHYATFGNHEQDGPAQLDGWPSYYWMFPPFNEDQNDFGARSWYSFDYNNIQFISLNSQLFYSYARFFAPQQEWLLQKLQRDDVRYTVIFFHISPYNSASLNQWDGLRIQEQWVPLFESAPCKVALVMGGHAHIYERLLQNGIHYLVAGSGSDTIYGEGVPMENRVFFARETCFPMLEFYEDRIALQTYTAAGAVIDQAELPLRTF
ncbi:MAG: hypothetical protein HC915_03680 [Anaerolineae bacterium]|nr:hypothetical protein [Anaerolineae bacterium]